jgi:RHS repeat-associated protein
VRKPVWSWANTFSKLGFVRRKNRRSQGSLKTESLQFQQLEPREMLTAGLPSVAEVNVSSTLWSPNFISYLESQNLGTDGYRVPVGSAAQEETLPWTNLDQVCVTFTEDVYVQQADLAVSGVNQTWYAFRDFQYNATTHTAVWTLQEPISQDKLLLDLDADGIDPVRDVDESNLLDGEWTNGVSAYPSGNGTAGGDFEFRLNLLPGDADASGTVGTADTGAIEGNLSATTGTAGYQARYDLDGNGIIEQTDANAAQARAGHTMPAGDPAGMTDDAPTTLGLSDVNVNEDVADQVIDLFAAFGDLEDADSALTFTIQSNSNPSLFASANIDNMAGTLTLAFAPNANGTAVLTVRATDTSGLSVDTTLTVNVAAVNDAPELAGIEETAMAYTENQGATVIAPSLVVSDMDSTWLCGALVSLGPGFSSDQDVLAADTTGTDIWVAFDAATGELTLAGNDTLTHYQQVLRSVSYRNTSEDPSTAPRTVSFQVFDNQRESNLLSRQIAVIAEPDAPAITEITTDTGVSPIDRITSDATLVITGTADVNTLVTVFHNGTIAGTTTASGAGTWSFDYTGTTLAIGEHTFTAHASDGTGKTSPMSAEFPVTIIAPPPEVTVLGNDRSIADGSTTPSTADHTDFGSVEKNGVGPTRTFTVRNDGGETLTLGYVSWPTGFTLVEPLASSLAPGASDTFTVRLDTTVAGFQSGPIRFITNDDDESPFEFTIAGTVVPPTVIVDNASATLTGVWVPSAGIAGYYGADYLHDNNDDKGLKSARFTPDLPVTGNYEVFARWTADPNRASNAPFEIVSSSGTTTVYRDQRTNNNQWVSLGIYAFGAGTGGNVLLRTTGTDGFVIADAVQFVLTSQLPPEITVLGNDQPIADGNTTPSTADHTDFGSASLGQAAPTRTFTVHNEGIGNLFLGAVSVPTGFTLVEPLASSLAPGASATFTVQLDTTAVGTYSGQISITTNDGDENPFNFTITGTVAPPTVIVDNANATITGAWVPSTGSPGYYGGNYLHDGNVDKGQKSVRFTPDLPAPGRYEVFARWPANPNRASNAPFEIVSSSGTTTVYQDQRTNNNQWVSLGIYAFGAGTAGSVLLRTMGTDGYVIADAVQFVWIAPLPPEITVLGNSQPIPDGSIAPQAANASDFGSAEKNGVGPTRTFTVRNDGTGALCLGEVSVPTGYVLLEGLSSRLAPGASDTFTVRLDTTTAGTYSGQISFTTNDGDENPFNFTITGTVVMPTVIVDNLHATRTGDWVYSTVIPGYYGANYLHDDNVSKGQKSVRFAPNLPVGGCYEVFARWPEFPNRASNVPFTITSSSGATTVYRDQRTNGGEWVSLGTYRFTAGTGGSVLIHTEGTDGYVIADGVRFVWSAPLPSEVTVLGNNQPIVDGDTASFAGNATDFGSAERNSVGPTRTFTVRNDGDQTLTLGGVCLPTGFTLVEPLVSSLAPGESDTFTVQLDTITIGTYEGQISFTTNDDDESPFDFTIAGTVIPPTVIVDNANATLTGVWVPSTGSPGYYGADYLHDNNEAKGQKSVCFTPDLVVAGRYEVFARWAAGPNRASSAPFEIVSSSGTTTVYRDQRTNNNQWMSLGTYQFAAGTGGSVLLSTMGTDGYVIADAVKFVWKNSAPVVSDATFTLAENSTNGTVVGAVPASDSDVGQSLRYMFLEGHYAFTIDPFTGQITVANGYLLDYETMPGCTLKVAVYDNGRPNLSGIAMITVNLTNVMESPIASIRVESTMEWSPYTDWIEEGATVTLDASASRSVEFPGSPLTYEWDLDGDGVWGEIGADALRGDETGVAPVLKARHLGGAPSVEVAVRVSDGMTPPRVETKWIPIHDDGQGPIASISGNASANEGEAYTLNLFASDAGDDPVAKWRIDWGDGHVEDFPGDSTSVTHVYADDANNCVIRAWAYDEHLQPFEAGRNAGRLDPSVNGCGMIVTTVGDWAEAYDVQANGDHISVAGFTGTDDEQGLIVDYWLDSNQTSISIDPRFDRIYDRVTKYGVSAVAGLADSPFTGWYSKEVAVSWGDAMWYDDWGFFSSRVNDIDIDPEGDIFVAGGTQAHGGGILRIGPEGVESVLGGSAGHHAHQGEVLAIDATRQLALRAWTPGGPPAHLYGYHSDPGEWEPYWTGEFMGFSLFTNPVDMACESNRVYVVGNSGGTVTVGRVSVHVRASFRAKRIWAAGGKILVAGSVLSSGFGPGHVTDGFGLIRLNSDLSLDTTFGDNGLVITSFPSHAELTDLCVQDDGKIVLTGWMDTDEGRAVVVTRYLAANAPALTVAVRNAPPVVDDIPDMLLPSGASLDLSEIVRITDPGFDDEVAGTRESLSYYVNWGDGQFSTGMVTDVVQGAPGRPTAGTLDLQHQYGQYREYRVTVTITDDDYGTAVKSFRVVHLPLNAAPKIDPIEVRDAYVNTAPNKFGYLYQAVALDADGDQPLVFSGSIDLQGLIDPALDDFHVSPDGLITWNPSPKLVDHKFTVSLTVEDPHGGRGFRSFDIYVHPVPGNHAPEIESDPSKQHWLPIAPVPSSDPAVDPKFLSFGLEGQPTSFRVSIDLTKLQVPVDDYVGADIVFVVDESGSMEQAHAWLQEVVTLLDAQLRSRGYADNHYGLVGFGATSGPPRAHPVGDSDRDGIADAPFGTAAELAQAAGLLKATGEFEDGYLGIDFALSQYVFRPNAIVNLVLITDENRDVLGLPQDVTAESLLSSLRRQANSAADDVTLDVIVTGDLYADADGEADDGGTAAGFTEVQGTWTVAPLAYTGTPDCLGAAALSIVAAEYLSKSFIDCSITVADSPSGEGKGFIVFDYVNAENFKFAGLDIRTDQWIIGSRNVSGWQYQVQISAGTDLMPDTTYEVSVEFSNDHAIRLFNNGLEAASYDFGGAESVVEHFAGVGVLDATATFGFYRIGTLVVIDPCDTQGYTNFTTSFGGTRALGVTHDHQAYLADGTGGYTPGTRGEHRGKPFGVGDPTCWHHYISLAWQTRGSVWDISLLRDGSTIPNIRPSFSSAFADAIGDRLSNRRVVRPVVNEPGIGFSYEPTGTPGEFLVTFTGDGLVHNFDLEFQSSTGVVLGTIPVAVNAAYVYELWATDPDGDSPLVFEWTRGWDNHGAVLENGVITWSPTAPGSYAFSVTVSDGRGGSDEQEWTVVVGQDSVGVNTPPELLPASPPNAMVRRGWAFTVETSNIDEDRLRYYLVRDPNTDDPESIPSGMAIDRNTGVITWVPTLGQEGSHTFWVRVADGRGGEDIRDFTVTVGPQTPLNRPPEFTSDPGLLAVVGEQYLYHVSAKDADGDLVTVQLLDAPSGMTLQEHGGQWIVSWVPSYSQRGLQNVRIQVADPWQATRPQQYQILVMSWNDPPVFGAVQPPVAKAGESFSYRLPVIDPNGDVPRFFLDPVSLEKQMRVTQGKLEWDNPVAGEHSVTVVADDRRGGVAMVEFKLTVEANGSPVISSPPVLYAVVGQWYTYDIGAADPDGDTLTFRVDPQAPQRDMAFGRHRDGEPTADPTNRLSWLPSGIGDYPVTVIVSDGGHEVRQSYLIRVVEPGHQNERPVVLSTPGSPAARNNPYRYEVLAQDLEGDPFTLSLIKPANLPQGELENIAFVDGVLTWTPTVSGTFEFGVVVDDGRGEPVVQTFWLLVLENAPPYFDYSTGAERVTPGTTHAIPTGAVDPNPEDRITYSLIGAPEGMAIDPATGVITWQVPPVGQIHSRMVDVIVMATDNHKATGNATYRFWIDGAPETNEAPEIGYTIPSVVEIGHWFIGKVTAVDPDGEPVTYSLRSAPRGMTIAKDGWIRWWPTAVNDPTQPHSFQVVVQAGLDEITQTFTFNVVQRFVNDPPRITSAPSHTAVATEKYVYEPMVDDDDAQQARFWSFVGEYPSGMILDAATGRIEWTPWYNDVGDLTITLYVTDGYDFDTQEIPLTVVGTNGAPTVRFNAPGIVVRGERYAFKVDAVDPEGQEIRYRVVSATSLIDEMGFETDQEGNVWFVWACPHAPTDPQLTPEHEVDYPYTQEVYLEITDQYGAGAQYPFSINVLLTEWNQAPIISPEIHELDCYVVVGGTFEYWFEARDPENNAVVVTLARSPEGMELGSGTDPRDGKQKYFIRWTPTAERGQIPESDAYPYPMHKVSLVAEDQSPDKLRATLDFEIQVIPPTQLVTPRIAAIGDQLIAPNHPFRLDVVARPDRPDGWPLVFELSIVSDDPAAPPQALPDGLTIDPTSGRIDWPSAVRQADGTPYSLRVTVTDRFGRQNHEDFRLCVDDNLRAPSLSVTLSSGIVEPGAAVTVRVDVVQGDLPIQAIRLYKGGANGTLVPLDWQNSYTFEIPPDQLGTIVFVAKVTDIAGTEVTSEEVRLEIQPHQNEAPQVYLDLLNGALITAPRDICGSIIDADLAQWTLSLTRVGSDVSTVLDAQIATGNIPYGKLAHLDPTCLENGNYTLTLHAKDLLGHESMVVREITIDGQFKLGNLNLTFVDLQIPLGGIPITVTRIYDSLQADVQGDFGYGWRLGLGQTKITTAMAGEPRPGNGSIVPMLKGSRVTVTLPDGSTESFTFEPQIKYPGPVGNIFMPYFIPDAGVQSRLFAQDHDKIELFQLDGSANTEYLTPDGQFSYNPAHPHFGGRYYLVTKTGEVLTINATTGKLEGATDRNGNTITYGHDGITSKVGDTEVRVVFERDPQTDCIRKIIAPDGSYLEYQYDPTTNDLVRVINRNGKATTYAYDAKLGTEPYTNANGYQRAFSHFLTSIADPRDPTSNLMEVRYAPDGRILWLKDAGSSQLGLEVKTQLGNDLFLEKNASGDSCTEVLRDKKGNVVRKIEWLATTNGTVYVVTVYKYDAEGNQTGESLPFEVTGPQSETYRPDDPTHRYNAKPQNLAWKSESLYENGKPILVTDGLGNSTTYKYDQFGNVELVIDPLGGKTTNKYDDRGNLKQVIDPTGVTTTFEYDPSHPGRLTKVIDGQGNVVSEFGYDQFGRMTQVTNASGVIQYMVYDAVGNQTLSYYHWTDPADQSEKTILARSYYDSEGRQTGSAQFVVAGTKSYTLTSAFDDSPEAQVPGNRLWATTTHYNDLGLVDYTVDQFGVRTENVYDKRGLLVETRTQTWDETDTRQLQWLVTRTYYDAQGRAEFTTDPYVTGDGLNPTDLAGVIVGGTHTIYDSLGRVVATERVRALVITFTGTATCPVADRPCAFDPGNEEAGGYQVVYRTTTHYDTAGRVDYTENQFGTKTWYRYDAADQPIETRTESWDSDGSPRWVVTRTVYDDAGRPVFTTDRYVCTDAEAQALVSPAVWGTQTVYDESGRVIGTNRLDGMRVALVEQGGQIYDSVLDAGGRIVSTTKTVYEEATGRVEYTIDQFGTKTYYRYDAQGRQIEIRTESSNEDGLCWLVTRTVYDAEGRPVFTTDPFVYAGPHEPPADCTAPWGTKTEYDENGRVKATHRVQYANVLVDTDAGKVYSRLSFPGTIISTTETEYDHFGRVSQSIGAHAPGQAGPTTYYVYDDTTGRLKAEISPAIFNADGTVQTYHRKEYFYDAKGRQVRGRENIRQTNPLVESTIDRTDARETAYAYDELGNLTKTTFADGTFITAVYDDFGRKLSETNQLNQTRTFEYDDGRLKAVVLPAINGQSPRYEYAYDAQGNQTLIRDPLGHETRFTYDAQGRQLTRTLPIGFGSDGIQGTGDDSTAGNFTERFEYDALGRQTLQVSFEGKVTQWVYDPATGRLKEQRFFDDWPQYLGGQTPREIWTYKYDAFGRQIEVRQQTGSATRTTTTTYDQEGRILQVASPEGTLNYGYDTLGRRIRVFTGSVDNPTEDIRYTYDALGRVATVEVSKRNGVPVDTDAGTAGNQPETTRYEYDLAGNLDREVKPNGVVSDYVYDKLNRLDTLTQFKDTNANGRYDAGVDALVAEYDYTVRDDGKRTAAVERFWFDDNADGTLDPHENRMTWIYDDLGRLTDEVFDHYDPALDQTEHFDYDLVGNRTQQDVTKGGVTESTNYEYDANDRLKLETSSTGRTTTYGYDHTQQTSKEVSENGTTSRTDYTYDLQGRMETATMTTYTDGTPSRIERTTYEYDASGIRVSAVHEVDADAQNGFEMSTKTEYLNDPRNPTGYSQVLKETVKQGDQVQKTVVYTVGLDQISQTTVKFVDGVAQPAETLVFGNDGHGSTRVLLNMAGAIATINNMRQLFHYDAYGNAVGFDTSLAATSFLYNNEQFDSLTGLSYLRARYYDPATGRFNRLDPFFGNLNDPQSLHKYLFCHGDPIRYVDPSGQFSTLSVTIGIGIVATLNVLMAAQFANAPGPDDVPVANESDPLAEAFVVEVVVAPALTVGFSALAPVGRWAAERLFGRVILQPGRAVLGHAAEVIWLNKIAVYLKGEFREKSYSVFKQAAKFLGKNIDDLAERVGYTEGAVPFTEMISGKLTASLPKEVLKEAPETQWLCALHELGHMLRIKEVGYQAHRAEWSAASHEWEAKLEHQAWNWLVRKFGDDIPAATESAYREFIKAHSKNL